ncbi:MAG TPA: flagellar protein FlgN [Gammaproteobacteria bacterium]|nr:flagellar protein FlgN [Gammaproteobacteria bacterium]
MAMDNTKQAEIRQVFQEEIACTRRLLQSLETEYDALAEHHADALEEAVREKQENISRLEAASRQREKLLEPYRVADTDSDTRYYQFDGNMELICLWDELMDIAEKCRDQNRVNGSIVELASKQSRTALDILRGILPQSVSASELYDNTGHAIKSASKRTLVQV